MAHLGPLGASTRDLAVFLEAVSGEDAEDELTHRNPGFVRGWLEGALGGGVKGLRIGVLEEEISAADVQVARVCREALAALEREGATLVPVTMRLAKHAPAVGYLSIGLEAFRLLLNDPRFVAVPMYLETAKEEEDGESMDEVNLRTLRSLVATVRQS